LGGFDTALNLVKKAINVGEKDEVNIVVFPKQKTLLESIMERGGADNSDKEAVGALAAMRDMLKVVQPVAREMRALGVNTEDETDDVLMMPSFERGR
jgi:hypothetical protein